MNNKIVKCIISILFGIFAVFSVYPLIWMAINSLKENSEIVTGKSFGLPETIRIANYTEALFEHNVLKYFINSVLVTGFTIVLTVIVSTMLAYALTRMVWKLSKKVSSLIMLGILLPSQIVIVPVFIMVRKLHLVNNPLALIITVSAFNIAMCTLIACGFLRNIPYEMEEAAVMDGNGVFGVFFRVIIPIIKPAIATMCINIFINSWNEFIYALVLITSEKFKTLPIGLMSYAGRYGTDYGGMFAAMVITSIIPVIVYIIFSEQVEKALTAGAILK